MTDTYHKNILERLTTIASNPDKQPPAGWSDQVNNVDEQNASVVENVPSSIAAKHYEGLERRLNPRIEIIAQPVDVALFENGEHRGTGNIRNISAHGVFVEIHAKFDKKDAHVQVQFELPDIENDYRAWGKVTHKTTKGVGIAMDVLEPKTLASLQAVEEYIGLNT